MGPTIAQIDDAARIYSYRRLTRQSHRKAPIVLGLNEKIERSLLKIFLSVLGLILLLGAVGYFGSSALRAWQVRRLLVDEKTGRHTDRAIRARRLRRSQSR
jgi:hypothetical protein